MEGKFIYDPKRGIDPGQLNRLQHQYAIVARPLRRQLEAGPDKLKDIRTRINQARDELRLELGSAAMELAQAKADLDIAEARFNELIGQRRRRQVELMFRRSAVPAAAAAAILATAAIAFIVMIYWPSARAIPYAITQAILSGFAAPTSVPTLLPPATLTPVAPETSIIVSVSVPTSLYAAPGAVLNVVTKLQPGDIAYAIGRSQAGGGLQVRTADGQIGWTYRSLLALTDTEYFALPLVKEDVSRQE